MLSLPSPRLAGKLLAAGLILLAVFHALVLVGALPPDIVWAGQVEGSAPGLFIMETVALAITLAFLLVVLIRLKFERLRTFTRVCLWLIGAFFLFSTIGNLTSDVVAENVIMAPFALILALLSFRLTATRQV